MITALYQKHLTGVGESIIVNFGEIAVNSHNRVRHFLCTTILQCMYIFYVTFSFTVKKKLKIVSGFKLIRCLQSSFYIWISCDNGIKNDVDNVINSAVYP